MSQIGRIGGQVLSDNLLRAGVDLAFETDLLYLDVNNSRIGIRNSSPAYTLDVNSSLRTNNLDAVTQITIDGIRINAPNTFTSTVAPIEVFIAGSSLFHDRLITNNIEFDDNFISSFSNSNIIFDPNGSGTVEIQSPANVTGTLAITGNIVLSGDLRSDGTVIFGDNITFDTVNIVPDLTQNILPGNDQLYDLGTLSKRWRNAFFSNVDITSGFAVGNITVSSPANISVSTGNLNININNPSPTAFFTPDIKNNTLRFDGNLIENIIPNQSIILNPNGIGAVNLEDTTNVQGNLGVSGNIVVPGDLSSQGTIIIGDQTIDTVTISPDFTQSIIPGEDLTYALGADAADSSPRRWAQVHAPDWTKINSGAWEGSGIYTQNVYVSEQMLLDGVTNKISTVQSNEDISLLPSTGNTYIEQTKWQGDDITNLLNSPITLASTGIGYVRILGDNGVVLPSGTDAERRGSPEVGETRWNTDQGYLECFDGTVWQTSIGAGPTVTAGDMDDLSNIFVLILG